MRCPVLYDKEDLGDQLTGWFDDEGISLSKHDIWFHDGCSIQSAMKRQQLFWRNSQDNDISGVPPDMTGADCGGGIELWNTVIAGVIVRNLSAQEQWKAGRPAGSSRSGD